MHQHSQKPAGHPVLSCVPLPGSRNYSLPAEPWVVGTFVICSEKSSSGFSLWRICSNLAMKLISRDYFSIETPLQGVHSPIGLQQTALPLRQALCSQSYLASHAGDVQLVPSNCAAGYFQLRPVALCSICLKKRAKTMLPHTRDLAAQRSACCSCQRMPVSR